MIRDAGRTDAYARALRAAITPQSVVLDIGTGTGILAMLACRFGARRVFAVEPGDAIVVAREIAAANGFADRIEFIQDISTRITLPELADVVVSDLHGVLPLFHQHIVAIADARDRLMVPHGTLIPRTERLWVSVVESAAHHREIASPWTENAYDFDMSVARGIVSNTFSRAVFEPGQLLARPVLCGTLDYRTLEDPDFAADIVLTASRQGTAHGLVVWFDSTLAEGVEFSNAPEGSPHVYGSAFFPWPEAVPLNPGDRIEVALRADLVGEQYVWQWESRVTARDDSSRVKARFRQSEFFGEPMSPGQLRKQAASHVPHLNEDGHIDRMILDQMDGGAPLEAIARNVLAQFPARFPRLQDALTRVGALSLRYSR